jgi:hypothetical protein
MLRKHLETLQKDYSNESSQNLLQEVTPSLSSLDRFLNFMSTNIVEDREHNNIAVVWGIIKLLFEVCSPDAKCFTRLISDVFRQAKMWERCLSAF